MKMMRIRRKRMVTMIMTKMMVRIMMGGIRVMGWYIHQFDFF